MNTPFQKSQGRHIGLPLHAIPIKPFEGRHIGLPLHVIPIKPFYSYVY